MNALTPTRFGLAIAFAILAGVGAAQSELSFITGLNQHGAWRMASSDGRGAISAQFNPGFTIGVGYSDQIESGSMMWMKAELLYLEYSLSLEQTDFSLCCNARDSASITSRSAIIRFGPEFEIGRNTRLFFPVDLSLPLSSTATGTRRSFVPPTSTTRHYSSERSDFGQFNLSVGAGLFFRLPVGSTYAVSLGPLATFGLFDQVDTMKNIRVYNYGIILGIQRRMVPIALLKD